MWSSMGLDYLHKISKEREFSVREGVKKKRFFLGLCPKLWVGGGQSS